MTPYLNEKNAKYNILRNQNPKPPNYFDIEGQDFKSYAKLIIIEQLNTALALSETCQTSKIKRWDFLKK